MAASSVSFPAPIMRINACRSSDLALSPENKVALGGFRRFDKMPVGNASILMGDLEPKPFQAFEVFGDRL
jgi:hypothetical protein